MKSPASHLFIQCAVLALAGGTAVLAQAGTDTNAPAALARATAPVQVRSVFRDDPASGKDPFFPLSVRRAPAVAPQVAATNAPPQSSELFNLLSLKGISGTRGQRFALINSATVGVGEKADVRAGSQSIKIRCREIRDTSVLVELVGAGEVRELKLREGI
jgi:hypothetical protein